MKTSSWIMWGLGLNVAAAALHGAGAPAGLIGASAAGSMSGIVPKLLLVAAGNFCLWRGLRSAIGDLWGGLTGRKYRPAAGADRSRGKLPGDESEASSDFDADAAFARYMAQRAAGEEPAPPPQRPLPHATRPRTPARAAPAAGGFGRKVV